jgi:putative ABC transport system substrate-binding protein
VALKPAVIVTSGSLAVSALQKETRTVPIVFGSAGDPVEQGFAKSLARPGGNITGVTLRMEISAKQVELAREMLPLARRIVALEHEGEAAVANRITEGFRSGASARGLELSVVRVKGVEELEHAFAEAARSKADIVISPALTLFALHARKLGEIAVKYRLPLVGGFRENALEGALFSYYSDLPENWRRAAVLVDKILKGARPAELPLEQPDRFLLVINLRTAKTLGITIPATVMLRADEVIE